MNFTSDIAPASSIRTLPAGTLDQADLWLAAQEEDPTYDPDLPYGPMMDAMP